MGKTEKNASTPAERKKGEPKLRLLISGTGVFAMVLMAVVPAFALVNVYDGPAELGREAQTLAAIPWIGVIVAAAVTGYALRRVNTNIAYNHQRPFTIKDSRALERAAMTTVVVWAATLVVDVSFDDDQYSHVEQITMRWSDIGSSCVLFLMLAVLATLRDAHHRGMHACEELEKAV